MLRLCMGTVEDSGDVLALLISSGEAIPLVILSCLGTSSEIVIVAYEVVPSEVQ